MVVMGAAALAYGVFSFMNHDAFAVYFVLFGMAAIFLFSGANVMPTSTNNRKAIENVLRRRKKPLRAMWTVSILDFRFRPVTFIR